MAEAYPEEPVELADHRVFRPAADRSWQVESPWRMPSAMNCVASTDFPVPEDPATRTLSPSRTPPSSILSSSGIPKERRRWLTGFLTRAVNPNVREKA